MNNIDDLKNLWNEVSQKEVEDRNIDIQTIEKIAQKKTLDSVDRIHRNMYIGLVGLVALPIILEIITIRCSKDIVPNISSLFDTKMMTIIVVSDIFNYIVIASIFLYTIYKLRKDRKKNDVNEDVKHHLTRVISLLKTFKKMMLGILLYLALYSFAAFTLGYTKGLKLVEQEQNIDITNIIKDPFFIGVTVVMFVILVLILWLFYYILMRLFYRRLYGNHLKTFQATLAELEEIYSDDIDAYSEELD